MQTATYPTAPTVTPLKGTLLDAATVTNDFAWLDGDDLFASYNCMKFQAEADFCAPNTKDFDNEIAWQNGFRFAAYGGVLCKAVGLNQPEALANVRRVFEAGESTAVERALMAQRFIEGPDRDAGAGVDLAWEEPVDITPAGGAVKPAVGLSLLEGFAANEYVGAPTLHVPVTIASLILGVDGAEFEGQTLRTKMGSKIAAGVGYDFPNTGPDGTEASAGEKWLYATGEVVIGRGPLDVRQNVDFSNNDVYMLAERPYIAVVDCFAAAVRVSVTA